MAAAVPAPSPSAPAPESGVVTPAQLGIGALFWRVRDAVTVTDASTGRPVLWNPAAERVFGYTAEEARSLTVEALIPERVRPQVLKDLAEFVATGRSAMTDADHALEYPIIRKDGQEIVIETSVSPMEPLPESGLRGAYLVAISRDVTERRRAEAERERRARHAALRADVSAALNSGAALPEILRRCTEAVVAHLGAAFARIWTLNEAEQVLELRASSGLYTHLDGPHGRVPVGAFKIGKIAEERAPHLTNDVLHDPRVGDKEWAAREGMVSFAGYPLLEEGRLLGVLALFAREPLPQDTLEALAAVADSIAHGIERELADARERALQRELAERAEALERSNKDLEQFAYVASHDLQEPLRTVVSYLQLLEEDYGETLGETGREFLHYAVDGGQRMQTLIDDLLSYSRIGRRGKPFGPVDMGAVLQDVLDDLKGAIDGTGATITADALPAVQGDAVQLSQVFQNLIGNALKFRGDDPPRVHVSAALEGAVEQDGETAPSRVWRFSVHDNGIGIQPEYHDQIFVIFQRLHVRDEYPGTGIGLAVCKKIVERHGGRLWVDSEAGKGSTFHFTLPASEEPRP